MKSNNKNFAMVTVFDVRFIVCDDGRVWRKSHNHWKLSGQTPSKNNGYHQMCVYGHTVYVHRLVAMAFVPNPNNYTEIDHIDGNPSNNNYTNIRWCSRSTNNFNRSTWHSNRPSGLHYKKRNLELA